MQILWFKTLQSFFVVKTDSEHVICDTIAQQNKWQTALNSKNLWLLWYKSSACWPEQSQTRPRSAPEVAVITYVSSGLTRVPSANGQCSSTLVQTCCFCPQLPLCETRTNTHSQTQVGLNMNFSLGTNSCTWTYLQPGPWTSVNISGLYALCNMTQLLQSFPYECAMHHHTFQVNMIISYCRPPINKDYVGAWAKILKIPARESLMVTDKG